MKLLTTLLKLALFAVVAVAALTIVGKVRQRTAAGGGTPALAGEKLSEAGFFLLKREEAKNPKVVIMSPPNCPSEDAQRARSLQASLQSAGVPCEMRDSIEFTFTDPKDTERVNKFMNNVANPLVLVRGWAKGNPTMDQVIAQYRAGK